MKNITTRNACYTFLLVSLLVLSPTAFAKKFFRWVDAEGEVHYSYTIPPSVSQKGYTKINESGRHIETISSADQQIEKEQTPEEETNDNKQTAEQIEAQKKYDNYLRATYLSIEELTAVYEKKKQVIEDQNKLYDSRILSLTDAIKKAEKQIKTLKNKAQKEKMQKYIDSSQESITVYKEMIEENQVKQEKLSANYEKDKTRLTELLSEDAKKEADTEGNNSENQ